MPEHLNQSFYVIGEAIRKVANPSDVKAVVASHGAELVGFGRESYVVKFPTDNIHNEQTVVAFDRAPRTPEHNIRLHYTHRILHTLFPNFFTNFQGGFASGESSGTARKFVASASGQVDSISFVEKRRIIDDVKWVIEKLGLPVMIEDVHENFKMGDDAHFYYMDQATMLANDRRLSIAIGWDEERIIQFMEENQKELHYTKRDKRVVGKSIQRINALENQTKKLAQLLTTKKH